MAKKPQIKKPMYIKALASFAKPDKEKQTFNMQSNPSWEEYVVKLSEISGVPVKMLDNEKSRSSKRQGYTRAVQRFVWQTSTYSVEQLNNLNAFAALKLTGDTITGTVLANRLSSTMNATEIDELMTSDEVKEARTIAAYDDVPESLPLAGTNAFGTDFENLF